MATLDFYKSDGTQVKVSLADDPANPGQYLPVCLSAGAPPSAPAWEYAQMLDVEDGAAAELVPEDKAVWVVSVEPRSPGGIWLGRTSGVVAGVVSGEANGTTNAGREVRPGESVSGSGPLPVYAIRSTTGVNSVCWVAYR